MKSNDRSVQLADLLDAIQDQSRIMIGLREEYVNKTDAARRLADLGIPPSRVASLLGKPLSQVTSALAKERRKSRPVTKDSNVDISPVESGGDGDGAR